jgi:hypothetical protein
MPTLSQQPKTGNQQPTDNVCRHIYTIGRRCGSPCLRGEEFCYYHHVNHRPPLAPITDPELLFAGPHTILDIPSLEDRPAIQLALLELGRRIGNNTIDLKRANALRHLYHTASINLTHQERTGTGCPIHGAAMGRGTTSTSSRPTSQSDRDRPSNRLPQPIPIAQAADIVREATFSPTLGPLAPVLEYGLPEPEEECEPSLASIINTYLNSPPPPPPVELDKRPYDFDTLQLLRRTLATTTNPETATRIRKALEEEALIPGHNLHIQACIDDSGCPGQARLTWGYSLLPNTPRSNHHHPLTSNTAAAPSAAPFARAPPALSHPGAPFMAASPP